MATTSPRKRQNTCPPKNISCHNCGVQQLLVAVQCSQTLSLLGAEASPGSAWLTAAGSLQQTNRETAMEGGRGGGWGGIKDKQKQTQTSRATEAVCESHVRQSTLWRKQQLVCTLTALQGLWPPQPQLWKSRKRRDGRAMEGGC